MTKTMRRLIYLAIGILAGVAAWPILELLISLQSRFPSFAWFAVATGGAFGLVFGVFFGSADGLIAANAKRIGVGAAIGALIGIVGGGLGFLLGQAVLLVLGQYFFRTSAAFAGVGRPLARALGWALLGIFVGIIEGVRARSGRKAAAGMIGGLVGGLIGGLVFEYAPRILPDVWARPLGLVSFGAAVAALYGFAGGRLSYGSLRVLNGIYKGREFILNQKRMLLGTAAGADVHLRGYARIAAQAAVIREQGGELFLGALQDDQLVRRNDAVVGEEEVGPLKFEDVVQIGSAKLFYKP
jgi:hypothetical protein